MQTPIFKKFVQWSTCSSGLHVDQTCNTHFQEICLSPLSRALGQLSKYEIKKGGHLFEAVPLTLQDKDHFSRLSLLLSPN